MPKLIKGDRILLLAILALMVFSLPIVFTSISTLAYKSNNLMMPLLKHFGLLLIGAAAMLVVHRIPFRLFSKLSGLIMSLAVGLLILTLIFGQNINSAIRSLSIFGISFQTSDFAKIAMVIFAASILAKNEKNINNNQSVLLPILAGLFVLAGLIMMADLSTAFLLSITVFAMLFIAGVKWYKLIIIIVIVGGFFAGTAKVLETKYPNSRVGTWYSRIESFTDRSESGGNSDKKYQSNQSKIAIATGFPFGKGPGRSTQRNVLPHPYSDFAFAMILEEWGIAGGIFVIIFYFIVLSRSIIIARRSESFLGSMMVIGLVLGIIFQALINMTVCTDMMPVTGQPLPFISMGGSSILFSGIAIGIILNVGSYYVPPPVSVAKP